LDFAILTQPLQYCLTNLRRQLWSFILEEVQRDCEELRREEAFMVVTRNVECDLSAKPDLSFNLLSAKCNEGSFDSHISIGVLRTLR